MSERAQRNEVSSDLFSLTQIRHLMRIEFSRAQRYDYPLACLVVVVDGLEQMRDERGYEEVESVFSRMAELLQAETRVCDFLGRLSHDLLVAVLPHTNSAGARSSAGRLVQRARAEGTAQGLTLSIGGACFEKQNTLFFDALLDAAEEAARRATAQGGNCTVFLDPGPQAGEASPTEAAD